MLRTEFQIEATKIEPGNRQGFSHHCSQNAEPARELAPQAPVEAKGPRLPVDSDTVLWVAAVLNLVHACAHHWDPLGVVGQIHQCPSTSLLFKSTIAALRPVR